VWRPVPSDPRQGVGSAGRAHSQLSSLIDLQFCRIKQNRERFIRHNCTGSECADIGMRLSQLRSRLLPMGSGDLLQTCSSEAPAPAAIPSAATATTAKTTGLPREFIVTVTGVKSRVGRNGTWVLKQAASDVWSGDMYTLWNEDGGWYLGETEDGSSFFWRAGDRLPEGQFRRCSVCPNDGVAIVTAHQDRTEPTVAPQHIETSRVSLPETEIGHKQLLLTLGLADVVQHITHCHNVTIDDFLAALKDAMTIEGLSERLKVRCPDIAGQRSIIQLNAIRGAFDRPALPFDEAFLNEICAEQANSKAEQVNRPAMAQPMAIDAP